MSKKELFTLINTLCREMDCEYDINNGGCCYVAAVIAECLEECNIQYSVYEYHAPCHITIKVSDRYLNRGDFSGDKELREYNSQQLYFRYNNDLWNEMYNAKKWNSIVSTKIKSLFKNYYRK